jgi:hypothetical protein
VGGPCAVNADGVAEGVWRTQVHGHPETASHVATEQEGYFTAPTPKPTASPSTGTKPGLPATGLAA